MISLDGFPIFITASFLTGKIWPVTIEAHWVVDVHQDEIGFLVIDSNPFFGEYPAVRWASRREQEETRS